MSQRDEEEKRKTVVDYRRETLFQALDVLDENKPDVPSDVKHQVGVALNSFRRALRQHRDEEDALTEPWDQRGVEVVDEWMNTEVIVEVPINRRGAAHKEEHVLAIKQVPVRHLEAVAQELLDIAKELGFSEHIDESTHRTEITEEQLEEVDKWRRQNLEA